MLAEQAKGNKSAESFRQFSLSLSGRSAPKPEGSSLAGLMRQLKEAVHVR
jgi:hypothetical protein